MKNEYVNRIAKVAQEKFEEAKNLILQEMQVALDKVDESAGDEDSVGSIIADFLMSLDTQEDDCDCECDCLRCEAVGVLSNIVDDDEGIAWINEDAIDFDEDYQVIGILMQKDADGELKVAIEYDEEIDVNSLPALLSKAIVEALYSDGALAVVFDKKDVDNEIGNAMMKVMLNLLLKGVDKILTEEGGDNA